MKKLWIFGSSLAVALVVFTTLISWYLFIYQSGSASMYGTMGQMMGGSYSNIAHPMPSYVWYSLVALIVAMSAGVFGIVYYLTFPEIAKISSHSAETTLNKDQSIPSVSEDVAPSRNVANESQSWSMLLRTSKPEERKVLEILYSHNGTHLQKLIVKESGLSKLKTHRIISRFAERGIVDVSKSGNTNEVRLSSWLSNQASGSSQKTSV